MAKTIVIEGRPSFAHKVSNGLWIGNAPPVKSMHENGDPSNPLEIFDTLVLCASEYQPVRDMFMTEEVVHAPMDDFFVPVRKKHALVAVRTARHVILRLMEGKQVLVTCLAGRNRSGLVCALALCFGPEKVSAGEAIKLVRETRGQNALRNPHFVKFLKSLVK